MILINQSKQNKSGLVTYPDLYKRKAVTLIDVLDRVLDKGVVVDGELVIRIADIDLIFIGLRLLVTSISRVEKLRGGNGISNRSKPTKEDLQYLQELEKEIIKAERNIPKIIDAGNPKRAERGIAKLVLTLVEFIRKILEKEAMRRIEIGNLSDTEIQKLGLTLKALEKKIEEIKAIFGIKERLNLELGPLGNLM